MIQYYQYIFDFRLLPGFKFENKTKDKDSDSEYLGIIITSTNVSHRKSHTYEYVHVCDMFLETTSVFIPEIFF